MSWLKFVTSSLRAKELCVLACAALGISASAQVQVTTFHNDNLRTGLNSSETTLNLSNVTPTKFGLLFSLPVDGQVYAQPLYLPRVTVPGKGVHSVVYVATEHNSLYAFDAASNTGANAQPLWHINFGGSVPNWDTGTDDIPYEIGITSTPVISLSNPNVPVIYVIAKTKSFDTQGNAVYTQKLHAINASSGQEMPKSPLVIGGSVPGTGDASVNGIVSFNPLIQHARPALLLVSTSTSINGFGPSLDSTNKSSGPSFVTKTYVNHNTLYATFASHGDNGPYHGWVFVYDVDKMQLLKIVNTTPNGKTDVSGYPIAAGGIWQGGGGPASDGASVFFATGNGSFNPSNQSFGDAILRLDGTSYSIADYFAPSNQLNLDDYDADLGSGEAMLLPAAASGSSGKNLLVQSGKEGTIYLLNTANLGKYGATDKIVQELPYVMGGIWGSPAYFNNSVYFGPQYSGVVAFPIKNGLFTSSSPSSYSPTFFQYPGPTPSVSANGTKNGIVWAVQVDNYGSGGPAVLHAFQASDLSVELYNSSMASGRDTLGPAVKFVTPTIADGHVYVGSTGSVGVFGLGTWAAAPVVSPASGNYQNSVTVAVTDPTPNSVIYYTTDGSIPTTSSSKYSGPVTLSASTVFKAKAFLANGTGGSPVTENDYLINAVIGNGTGLTGNYYNNTQNPGGTPTWTEVDPTVNFNWNGNSPANGVAGSNWAGEWTGQLQAEVTGPYTLSTNSDDGVQVYINGQLVINNYTYHAPTLDYGTVNLVAGQKYTIDIKFFQGGGGSVLQLFWATPGIANQIIPTTQLYKN